VFKKGQQGILDEVSIFVNNLKGQADKALIADRLKFEGSNDGSTWTEIWKIG